MVYSTSHLPLFTSLGNFLEAISLQHRFAPHCCLCLISKALLSSSYCHSSCVILSACDVLRPWTALNLQRRLVTDPPLQFHQLDSSPIFGTTVNCLCFLRLISPFLMSFDLGIFSGIRVL